MQRTLPFERVAIAAALLAAGMAVACTSNDSGQSDSDGNAASPDADVNQVIDPVSPVDEMIESCGDGALAADAPISREPYLQQVGTSSAIVGWVTTTDGDEHVEITTPALEPVGTAAAAIENTIVPSTGMQQRWATIEDLAPDTVYCYSLVSGDRPLTARAGFRTAPAADDTEPVRFVALGDSGTGGFDQRAVFEQMRTVPHDLILHVGDIAYTSGTIDEFEARVFAIYAPALRHVPFFPVAGNHEYVTDDAAPFRAAFALPNNERWYSFDWGRVHFAGLDTEEDLAQQAAWLDADLAASDRPWKIVFLHKPPYSSGEHGSYVAVRDAFAPVLERHGVQLVLSGHDHDYERTHPQNGVTYIVTGGGGAGLRPVGSSEFTAFAVAAHHFVQVEVEAEDLTLRAIDPGGVELDVIVIPRVP